jgi:hypothetical protein
MLLSEALRKWKSNITTHMAVGYVLTLRADINAFSDAAYALERENASLRHESEFMRDSSMEWCKKAKDMRDLIIDMSPDVFVACEMCGSGGDVRRCRDVSCRFKQFHDRMRGLGIEVTP